MGRGKVLLIEDDVGLLRLVGAALQAMGFTVQEARDGYAGLEQQRRTASDIVVTDVFMPHMDGIEATRAFRKEFPDVKIIAASGAWEKDELDASEVISHFGVDRFVKKPYTIVELGAVIDSLLPES